MQRGEIYWHIYRDKTGQERKIPFLIVSNDAYNAKSDFVNGIRMVHFDTDPQPQHIPIPEEALSMNTVIKSSVVLCETISSVRKANLQGPAAMLPEGRYMKSVCDGIKSLCGMDAYEEEGAKEGKPESVTTGGKETNKPWYSANLEAPENKQTRPMTVEGY